MSDELFARAARALRESHDGASDAAARTRAEVLLRATTRRKRRRLVVAVLLPIAAAFVLSTAWAAVTGRLPHWLARLRGQDDGAVDVRAGGGGGPPALPRAPVVASAPETGPDAGLATEGVPAARVEPSAPPAPAQTGPVSAVRAPASAERPANATTTATAPSAASTAGREEQLFAAAQHEHFVAHDPQAALRAWDAYLAAYPGGRFAIEARYNRAITLVRLGRTDEARAALRPFADARGGGYRQHEAADLLRALDGGAP